MSRIILFILFIAPLWANAQVQLKGNVASTEEAIGWANVILLDLDGKLVKGTMTDENGAFSLAVSKGEYKLNISYLGFSNWEKDFLLAENIDLGTLLLEEDGNNLEEIIVTGRKRLIEQKTDRLVFNVENSPSISGGDGIDALKAAPGLMIQNNTINMIGKGVSQVMINDRILELTGEELINFLNTIAADDIQKIEIITNPPAKYQAEGNGGLINIVYKKGVNNSWKNSSTFAHSQSTYHFQTLRNTFFYHKDKINFSLNTSGTLGNERNIERFDVYFPTGTWKFISDSKNNKGNYSGRVALDYDLTDRLTIGGQYLGTFSDPSHDANAFTKIFNSKNKLDSLYINTGRVDRKITSHVYNLHAISKLDTLGRTLSFDVDYFDYDNNLDQGNLVNTFSSNDEFLGINHSSKNYSLQSIDNFSAKADINHPLKTFNLSYGAKYSLLKTVNDLQNFNTASGAFILNNNLSNAFEYEEQIQAVYVNGSKKINDKWNLQMGLRLEHTQTKGFSKTLNQTNKNNYKKLFPTFYVAYQKNENHSFSFNYGRRTRRPNFRDLNPFRVYANSNTYSEGNPFIQASYTDNFEFSHNYKGLWTTNIFYNYTTDGFGTIFTADAETSIQAIIRRNFYNGSHGGIGQIITFDKLKWWSSRNQVFLMIGNSVFDKDIDAIPQNGAQLYLSTNNTFHLSKTTKLEVNFWYSSAYKANLFDIGDTYSLNFGFKQSLLKNNLQIAVLFNDVLNTASLDRLSSVVNGVETIYSNNYSSRFVRFSLSYSFGNHKINVGERNFGNDEERRRSN